MNDMFSDICLKLIESLQDLGLNRNKNTKYGFRNEDLKDFKNFLETIDFATTPIKDSLKLYDNLHKSYEQKFLTQQQEIESLKRKLATLMVTKWE